MSVKPDACDTGTCGTCLECHVARIKEELGGGVVLGPEVAERLPEHLRAPFWRRQVDRWMAKELGTVSDADPR